jgi:hypothetical protein
VNPTFKPSIYALQFCGTGCLCEVKILLSAKYVDGTGVLTLCIQSYQQFTYRTPLNGKINFDICNLMSKYSNLYLVWLFRNKFPNL